jgi:hypothetical protein
MVDDERAESEVAGYTVAFPQKRNALFLPLHPAECGASAASGTALPPAICHRRQEALRDDSALLLGAGSRLLARSRCGHQQSCLYSCRPARRISEVWQQGTERKERRARLPAGAALRASWLGQPCSERIWDDASVGTTTVWLAPRRRRRRPSRHWWGEWKLRHSETSDVARVLEEKGSENACE